MTSVVVDQFVSSEVSGALAVLREALDVKSQELDVAAVQHLIRLALEAFETLQGWRDSTERAEVVAIARDALTTATTLARSTAR